MTLFHRQTGQLRAWARRTLWCIIVIGSLCAIVIPIFSIYRKEGDNTRSVVEVPPQGVSHTGDYIHVLGSVASVDFEDKNFRVHFEFTPHGTLAGDDGLLTNAIAVSLFYTTLTFPDSQIMYVSLKRNDKKSSKYAFRPRELALTTILIMYSVHVLFHSFIHHHLKAVCRCNNAIHPGCNNRLPLRRLQVLL